MYFLPRYTQKLIKQRAKKRTIMPATDAGLICSPVAGIGVLLEEITYEGSASSIITTGEPLTTTVPLQSAEPSVLRSK